jgi:hypothetical protein
MTQKMSRRISGLGKLKNYLFAILVWIDKIEFQHFNTGVDPLKIAT